MPQRLGASKTLAGEGVLTTLGTMSPRTGLCLTLLGFSLGVGAQACTASNPGEGGSGGSGSVGTGSAPGTTENTTSTTGQTTTATTGLDLTTGATTAEPTGETEMGDDEDPEEMLVEMLPSGFTAAPNGGGFMVVGALDEIEVEDNRSCVNVLRVVVRDFLQSHIDFGELKPEDWLPPGLYTGLLLPDLDATTRKPTVNPSRTPADVIESFEDWYINTPNVNKPYVMDLWLQPQEGFFVFDTTKFFPLETPWNTFSEGDEQSDGVGPKNFLFTTEIHTAFEYKGNEVFNFRGDDDVWIFVNNKLAVDIGGIHSAQEANIDLAARGAEFGLTVGEVYNLDMFQAERNPVGSNFRIQTSLDFKECSVLPNDIIR